VVSIKTAQKGLFGRMLLAHLNSTGGFYTCKICEQIWKNKHAIMKYKNVLNRIPVEVLGAKCTKGKGFNLI